jgi:putative flippase GtrA
MRKRLLPSQQTQVRFLKSLAVGATAFGVQAGVLWVLKRFLAPLTAFSWAYGCSVVTHYSLNRFWALRSERRDSGRQLLEYVGTVLIGWLIQSTVFRFCIHTVGMGIMWANFFAVPPSTIVVIFILNYRVFHQRGHASPSPGSGTF